MVGSFGFLTKVAKHGRDPRQRGLQHRLHHNRVPALFGQKCLTAYAKSRKFVAASTTTRLFRPFLLRIRMNDNL